MKIFILLLSLMAGNSVSSELTLFTPTKPIIYVINQNPIDVFQGSRNIRLIVHTMPDYHVYVYFINMDFISSLSGNIHLAQPLIDDIKRVRPQVILTSNTELEKALRLNAPEYRILSLMYRDTEPKGILENHANKVLKVLDSMNYEYDKIYILYNDHNNSKRDAKHLEKSLGKLGFIRNQINLIEVNSIVYLESHLRELNLKPQSVIINMLFTVDNTESGKTEYLPDIKEILHRVNRKHLDMGFYRTATLNECIVFDNNFRRIREYIDNEGDNSSTPLESQASFNLDRMDTLKLKRYYLEGLPEMDDIIK